MHKNELMFTAQTLKRLKRSFRSSLELKNLHKRVHKNREFEFHILIGSGARAQRRRRRRVAGLFVISD